jgi:hypothetical protein
MVGSQRPVIVDNRDLHEVESYHLARIEALQARVKELEAIVVILASPVKQHGHLRPVHPQQFEHV